MTTVTAVGLTNGDSTVDATSWATASVSPTNGRPVILAVANTKGTTPDIPTATGAGLTWTQIQTIVQGSARRVTLFLGTGTPSAGAITIDFAGNTQTGVYWDVTEFTNAPATSTTLQPTTGIATGALSLAITLGAFAQSSNATYGAFLHAANEASTQGSGYSVLANKNHATPVGGFIAEFRSDSSTTVDASWATSSSACGIGLEIKSLDQIVSPTATATAETWGSVAVTQQVSPTGIGVAGSPWFVNPSFTGVMWGAASTVSGSGSTAEAATGRQVVTVLGPASPGTTTPTFNPDGGNAPGVAGTPEAAYDNSYMIALLNGTANTLASGYPSHATDPIGYICGMRASDNTFPLGGLAEIAADALTPGTYTYQCLTKWAAFIGAWPRPAMVRMWWECNGTTNVFGTASATVTNPAVNNSAANYILAWQAVHNFLVAAGVRSKVQLVWTGQGTAGDFADRYPGDAYVDWIALDVTTGSATKTAATSLDNWYPTWASHGKPMMISEWHSHENTEVGNDRLIRLTGGVNSYGLTEPGFLQLLKDRPQIKSVTWWDLGGASDPQYIEDVPAGFLAAYQTFVADPYMNPPGLFGSPTVTQQVNPSAIASAESFGSPVVTLQVSPTAISSAQALGTPVVTQLVQPTALTSAEAWGTPTITQLVQPTALASTEAWGSPTITQLVSPVAVGSVENWGTPVVTIAQFVQAASIASAEDWGFPDVSVKGPSIGPGNPESGWGPLLPGFPFA